MKTTANHFKIFKQECKKWIDFWGLYDWKIEIKHTVLEDSKAEFWASDLEDKYAWIILNKDWGEKETVNDMNVRESAFHEVMEIRYAKLADLAKKRFISETQIQEAVHDLIRQDENIIFRKGK